MRRKSTSERTRALTRGACSQETITRGRSPTAGTSRTARTARRMDRTPKPLSSGAVVARRFLLQKLAGRGGMGEVWRARDSASGEDVALKLLHTDATTLDTERFAREARILSEIRHPRIVSYVAHGTCEDHGPFLTMQWLEGEDLAHRLSRGPLSTGEALLLLRRIAEPLAALHARGVVHRDLKPSNVLLQRGDIDQATLVDLGIARTMGPPTDITAAGKCIGTHQVHVARAGPERAPARAKLGRVFPRMHPLRMPRRAAALRVAGPGVGAREDPLPGGAAPALAAPRRAPIRRRARFAHARKAARKAAPKRVRAPRRARLVVRLGGEEGGVFPDHRAQRARARQRDLREDRARARRRGARFGHGDARAARRARARRPARRARRDVLANRHRREGPSGGGGARGHHARPAFARAKGGADDGARARGRRAARRRGAQSRARGGPRGGGAARPGDGLRAHDEPARRPLPGEPRGRVPVHFRGRGAAQIGAPGLARGDAFRRPRPRARCPARRVRRLQKRIVGARARRDRPRGHGQIKAARGVFRSASGGLRTKRFSSWVAAILSDERGRTG